MEITLGQQYNVGEKPTVILYTYLVQSPCRSLLLKYTAIYFRFLQLTAERGSAQCIENYCVIIIPTIGKREELFHNNIYRYRYNVVATGRPRKEGTLEMARRAVWGMLYADDAGVASTSPRGLTRMMGITVAACQEFGLTLSEKKTEAVRLWSHPHTASNALRIEAAGQRYKQTTEFGYFGDAIGESADLDIEIKRRIGAAWASVRKYSSQLYDRRNARLSLKIRLFKAEVMEAMLYGCATRTMRSQDFSSLRTTHRKLLLRIIGFRRKDRTGYKPLSYREVLERIGSERIESTIRKR